MFTRNIIYFVLNKGETTLEWDVFLTINGQGTKEVKKDFFLMEKCRPLAVSCGVIEERNID